MSAADLVIRAAEPSDHQAVLDLLGASLGWVPDGEASAYFSWKHHENPAGDSPAWVAERDGRILGFRTMLRWTFEAPGGGLVRAVRAVDTATHPDAAGQGIFRRLTLHALDALAEDGTSFVFNTPNDQSRPGYLSMGWVDLGRLPASVRPSGLRSLLTMVGSRQPAQRWSEATDVGTSVREALSHPAVTVLLADRAPARSLRTHRTSAHLAWRYGFEPLRYRAITLGADPAEGLAIFRLRRRGAAVEAALCEVLAPRDDATVARRLVRDVARRSGADYVIRLGGPLADGAGFVRLPGQGPRLTWRSIGPHAANGAPPASTFALGDIELL